MKKLFTSIALTVPVLAAIAQSNPKLEAQIKGFEQEVVIAILHADSNVLIRLWAPEFLVNTPRNTIADGRAAVFQIQKAGMIDYSVFERVVEKIQFQKKVAITMGYELFVSRRDIPGTKAGQEYRRRFTNVWMKKKGKWQQIARHASVICE